MTQPAAQPTFEELCRIEPRLLGLLDVARTWRDQYTEAPCVCANELWAGPKGLKSKLVRLVGWRADKPELRTSHAYDLAFETIYDALPACRGCACIDPTEFADEEN